MSLSGKTALVTGSAQGIGLAIATRLAREGARVGLFDINREQADQSAADLAREGLSVFAGTVDVVSQESIKAMLETMVARYGALDIVVNNAGILQDKSLLGLSESMWDEVMAVHLRGAFLCTQAAAAQMRLQRRGGRIINTTSISGLLGNLGQANESAAKAGVYGLTRTASIELQKYGINVNAVAPIARTRLTEDLPMFEKVGDTLEPAHVAPVYTFLASELANEVSGMVFSVAGGRLSTFQLVESAGRLKDGIWTPEEIAEHLESISKV